MAPDYSDRNYGSDNLTRNVPDFTDSSHDGQLSSHDVHLIDHAANILATTLHIDLAFDRFATQLRNLVPFDRLAIHLVDLKDRSDVIKYVSGEACGGVQAGNRQPLDNTEAQDVMLTGQSLVRGDMVIGPRFCRDRSYLELGLRASIVVGLRTQLHFVGIINLASRTSGCYGSREEAILERLAAGIAPAIASASLYESAIQEQEQVKAALDRLKSDRNDLEARLSLALDELRRLSHALNVCPSAIMIADRGATIRYVNRKFTQLTGYGAFEVVGKPVKKLASSDEADEGYRRLGEMITSGGPWAGECRTEKKGGRKYWSSRSISPVRDGKGIITHVVVAEEDISDKKMLQAKLLGAQKMESMGYLVAGITHDFNNLLLAMLGFTALLEARLDPSTEAYEYSTMVESLAKKGVELTRQILTSGKKALEEGQLMDLNMAVLEVLHILKPTFSQQIQVDLQLQEDLPRIIGDLGKLEQVIMNLCLNAADAMPKGGRLGVATTSIYLDREFCRTRESLYPGKFVRLKVTDTGIGISEESRTKIFEPFYTTKGGERGTGLGLSLVEGIVRDHGGIIQVNSTLGRGSDFTLYLPLYRTAE